MDPLTISDNANELPIISLNPQFLLSLLSLPSSLLSLSGTYLQPLAPLDLPLLIPTPPCDSLYLPLPTLNLQASSSVGGCWGGQLSQGTQPLLIK